MPMAFMESQEQREILKGILDLRNRMNLFRENGAKKDGGIRIRAENNEVPPFSSRAYESERRRIYGFREKNWEI